MSPRNDERSSDEIRREIESTRAEMDETVDELERRLSPGQLLDEAWHAMRGGGGVGDVVRSHPVPLALMGLGVAWLAVERATGDSDHRRREIDMHEGTYGRAEGRVGPYRGDAIDQDDSDWAHNRGAMTKAKDKVSDALSGAGDKLSSAAGSARGSMSSAASTAKHGASIAAGGAKDRASEMAHGAADRARDAADRAGQEARHRARQAKHGFESLMDDSPLAVGAIAFGLGLASGLAAPTTRFEDRVMGDTAESLKREARETAKDVGERATAVAADAAAAARDEAERQDLGHDIKESARRIADEAKSTARQRAREEDLTREGIQDRAREVGERTRQSARDEMR